MRHSKIPVGPTYVSCMAYFSPYVLIINFFLFTFFWVFVEYPIFVEEVSSIDSILKTEPEPEPFNFVDWALENLNDENREMLREHGCELPTREQVRLAKALSEIN